MKPILIAEDDLPISDLIAMNLALAGYECVQAMDGEEALNHLETQAFALALLDIMLPKKDGYELLEEMKRRGIPVIFLTAMSALTDKVKGLRAGADDYITKPFEGAELLARMEAVLRRCGEEDNTIQMGELTIEEEKHQVMAQGNRIDLTMKEYELLLVFYKNRNKAISREKLLEEVWGYEYMGESRTVDMHVQRLRKKLEGFINIATVYKYGYRLELEA